MSEKAKDLNDLAREGKLPDDPGARASVISADVPRIYTVKELLVDSCRRASSASPRVFCTWGHAAVDEATGGFQPEFVWVIGAETSWGKSTLAVAIADENIKLRRRVMIISVEDPKALYADRLMARRTRISASDRRMGKLTRTDIERMGTAAAKAEDDPVYIDARGRSIEWIADRIPGLVKEHGIHLVMFDYLQAADNEKPQQDRKNQVTYIMRKATDAMKLSGAAGVMFSQITMSDEKPIPDKHSVRDSKSVSHMAEGVAMGFRPKKHVVDSNGTTLVEGGSRALFVDKNKDGPEKRYFQMSWDNRAACYNAVGIDGRPILPHGYSLEEDGRR